MCPELWCHEDYRWKRGPHHLRLKPNRTYKTDTGFCLLLESFVYLYVSAVREDGLQRERPSDPLELGLQAAVSCLRRMLDLNSGPGQEQCML